MTYYLFLDDERLPSDVTWVDIPRTQYIVARNYLEFVDYVIKNGVPLFISFDHDLADEHYAHMLKDLQKNSTGEILFRIADEVSDYDYGPEETGYECAKWLVNHCIENQSKFPEYAVHSMNPVGSKRIKDYIEWAKTKIDTL